MSKVNLNLKGKSGVYQILNIVNNKKYIGSSLNIYTRFHEHISNMNYNHGHNAHLQAAWNKYGEQNFEFSVIEFCSPENRLIREQYYIDLYKPEYNLSLNVKGNLNRVVTEVTRQKISQTLIKKYQAKEITSYRQDHMWKHCWIYDIYSNDLVKECDCLFDAVRYLGYNKFPGNNPLIHLYRKKYCILLQNIENELDRFNFISKTFKQCKSKKGLYLIVQDNEYHQYFKSLSDCLKKYHLNKKRFIKGTFTEESPYFFNNIKIYYTNTFIPLTQSCLPKELDRVSSGNIGGGPQEDNTEINLESKKSKSSYSVESEP